MSWMEDLLRSGGGGDLNRREGKRTADLHRRGGREVLAAESSCLSCDADEEEHIRRSDHRWKSDLSRRTSDLSCRRSNR